MSSIALNFIVIIFVYSFIYDHVKLIWNIGNAPQGGLYSCSCSQWGTSSSNLAAVGARATTLVGESCLEEEV